MLTNRMQIQVIADLLSGIQPSYPVRLEDFAEPWRTCYQDIAGLPMTPARLAFTSLVRTRADGRRLWEIISSTPPGAAPPRPLPSLADLAGRLPSITWLWPGWIPLGMLTLLGGAPGAGKSYLALDLARRVTTGEPFPLQPAFEMAGAGGADSRAPANVIYVDAECVPQVLHARLSASTVDPHRLFLLQPPGASGRLDLSSPDTRARLIEAAATHRPALLVIDSLAAAASGGENNVPGVQAVLGFLSALAADTACAALLVHHLRKRSALVRPTDLAQDDFRGSSHVTAVPRCVLGLSIVQTGSALDRNAPRLLEVVKTNLGPPPDPIGVTFTPLGPHAAHLSYGPPPRPYHPPTELDRCASWLLDTLSAAAAPVPPTEVVALAAASGFSRSILYRARAALAGRVLDTGSLHSPQNRWFLAAPCRPVSPPAASLPQPPSPVSPFDPDPAVPGTVNS